MNMDNWAPCTLELLEQTAPSYYDHGIPALYEHTVPYENVNTIVEGIRPDEVEFDEQVELVSTDGSERTMGYRQIYEAPAVISAVTGRILAAGSEEEAITALHSMSDTVPVIIKMNRDFMKDDPETPIFSIEVRLPRNPVTEEVTLVEDAFTPDAVRAIEKTLAIIEGNTGYNTQ